MAKKRLDTEAVHAGQETADPTTGTFAQLMNAAANIKHRGSANIFLNLFSIFILFSELCRQPKVHILYYIIVAESFYKVTTCYLRFSPF